MTDLIEHTRLTPTERSATMTGTTPSQQTPAPGGARVIALWKRDGFSARRNRKVALVTRPGAESGLGLVAVAELKTLADRPAVVVRGTEGRAVTLTAQPQVFAGHGAIPFERNTDDGAVLGAVWTSRDSRGEFRVAAASEADRVAQIVQAHLTEGEALALALSLATTRDP